MELGAAAPSAGGRGAVLSRYFENKQCLFKNRLTFHPVIHNFLSLLGGALGEPVVAEQRCDLVGVHQLPRHEGQRAKGHLFIAHGVEQQQQKQ